MKQKLARLLALIFGLIILGVSLGKAQPALAVAAEEEAESVEEEAGEAVAEGKAEESEYALPYPGMLPDHPLYFLKMIRDRVQLFLARDTLVKYRLLLNNADKRIGAGLTLAEEGKTGLAATTAIKAELYLKRAIDELEKLTAETEERERMIEETLAASDKHALVLMGIFSRLPEENQDSLNEALKLNVANREQVIGLLEADKQEPEAEEEAESVEEEAGEPEEELSEAEGEGE